MRLQKLITLLLILSLLCSILIIAIFTYQLPQKLKTPTSLTQIDTNIQHQAPNNVNIVGPPILRQRKQSEKHADSLHSHPSKVSLWMNKYDMSLSFVDERTQQHNHYSAKQDQQVQRTKNHATYWVDAKAKGNGKEGSPAGNISYVLNNNVSATTYDTIKVQPGTYNRMIEGSFPLYLDTSHVTLTSTTSASTTLINGTGNNSTIVVTSNNITIKGFTIKNQVKYYGGVAINLDQTNNVMITDNIINNTGCGVLLNYSEENTITNNTINNFGYGVFLNDSKWNKVSFNTITRHSYGVYLLNSNENTIRKNTFTNNNHGIKLERSCGNTIIDNIMTDNVRGIKLDSSNENIIMDNYITHHSDKGIVFYGSISNRVSDNVFKNNYDGIVLYGSTNITITCNVITKNRNGIFLDSSNESTVKDNIIADNTKYGIYLKDASTDNLVYRNDFVGNGGHAKDMCGGNSFNNSDIGNYWGNYKGMDMDWDGIGDTPYKISGGKGSKDYLPSIETFKFEAGRKLTIFMAVVGIGISIVVLLFVIYEFKKKTASSNILKEK